MYRGFYPVPSAAKPSGRLKVPDFETAKTAYIHHLTLRNLSPLGISQVERDIRLFIGFLEDLGVRSIVQVDADVMERYKAHMTAYRTRKGMPLCLNTVRARLFTALRWLKFLRKKGVLLAEPVDVQPPPRVKRLPRGVLTPDEVKAVMAQPDLRGLLGYRDRTMMETLYSTGMRAAELCNLEIRDLDFEKKAARIRNGKGGKERFVLLSPPCIRFLERYLKDIRPELAQGIRPAGNNWLKKFQSGGNLVFLSIYGGPLTRQWLAQMMKQYIRRAGIERIMSPVHCWRHSCATHLMSSGMDIRYVQILLGHAHVNTTQIYTHVERKSLQGQLGKYHPGQRGDRRGFVPFLGEPAAPDEGAVRA